MTKPRHKPYSGELAKPLPKSKLDGIFGLGERFGLEHERLKPLLRHYGLNEDHADLPPEQIGACWYQLALASAREHNLAFREEARGRRQIWSEQEEALLCLRVWSLARTNGGNESAACRQLNTEPPYSELNITGKSLYSRFKQAERKNRLVDRLRDELREAETAALVDALRG